MFSQLARALIGVFDGVVDVAMARIMGEKKGGVLVLITVAIRVSIDGFGCP